MRISILNIQPRGSPHTDLHIFNMLITVVANSNMFIKVSFNFNCKKDIIDITFLCRNFKVEIEIANTNDKQISTKIFVAGLKNNVTQAVKNIKLHIWCL